MRIALFQARTGIDPEANARGLIEKIAEAKAGGAGMLFTPAPARPTAATVSGISMLCMSAERTMIASGRGTSEETS